MLALVTQAIRQFPGVDLIVLGAHVAAGVEDRQQYDVATVPVRFPGGFVGETDIRQHSPDRSPKLPRAKLSWVAAKGFQRV